MMQTECIILAAGYSSRAGTNKMLLKLGNKTVLERCIDSFYGSCSRIYVIGGHRMEDIKPVLMKYNNLRLVSNANYSEGMFSSVKVGLQCIQTEQFFITPGDYPLLHQETINQMLKREEPIIIPRYHGIPGHPVRMKSNLIPEILNGKYENLNEFITSKTPHYLEVYDLGVITDIDTMEDYEKILKL